MKKLYSLQGIIFQKGNVLGTAEKSGIGIAVTIKEAMHFAMFHSVVGPDGKYFSGMMQDRWGNSAITMFKMNENEISFCKQYSGRPLIHYKFTKKEGNVWIGAYTGKDSGEGGSKLIVTEIDENFFQPVDLVF